MVSGFFVTTAPAGSNFGRGPVGLDLNGDGFGDLVIGSDLGADGVGIVQVVYGQAGGFDASVDLGNLTQLQGFSITGPSGGSEFGYEVQNIGDQNADGRDDLAIAARASGTITILYTPDENRADLDLAGGISASDGFTISGLPALADILGVQSVGDFNGDGTSDFLVTSSADASGTGVSYLVYGQAAGTDLDVTALSGANGFAVTGLKLRDQSGHNAAALGDINADGKADVLLGSDGTTSGDLSILLGSNTAQNATSTVGDLSAQILTLTGLAANVAPGASVSGGSDLNDDGIIDIIVGADQADIGGVNTGSTYVIFGSGTIGSSVDLTTLDGSDGFAVHGLNAGDMLGQVVESFGDVSGDGIGDIGLMTEAGTLYLIYGQESGTAFPASFDLASLDGINGYVIDGLTQAGPDGLGLAGVPSLNADEVNDIAISSTTVGGTVGQTFVLLGGADNLAALDVANGGTADGKFDGSSLGTSTFVGTNITTTVTGDAAASLTEDQSSTTGSIGATTSIVGGTAPSFANRSADGAYGALLVNAAGTLWTYEFFDTSEIQAAIQSLDAGDALIETITLAATDKTARTITITVQGLDDAAFLESPSFTMTEDKASLTGALTLTDVDADDSPSLISQTIDGTYGKLVVNGATGAFELFMTNADAQNLSAGETATDNFVVVADDGSSHTVSVEVTGADEGSIVTFDDTNNAINTSYGDDLIDAAGGDDTINTGAGNDSISAGAGNDIVTDAFGDTTVDGGLGNDSILLGNGAGNVSGGAGSDYIRTGYQSDSISGGAGNDVIDADFGALLLFGNDTVDGGKGDDLMMAGLGVDIFVFRPADGNDTIGKFDAASVVQSASGFSSGANAADFTVGVDVINLAGFTDVTAANVLSFLSADGISAVFETEGTQITLVNVDQTTLSVDDFLFT
jgi:VCBS repeat-containing protein